MKQGVGIKKIAAAAVIVNAAGLLLRYFGLETYLIIAGFRFHIAFVLPALIVLPSADRAILKRIFLSPFYRKNFSFVGWIFLPIILITGVLFIANMLSIGDPDYFYELGLSSIIDYPVYLVWNLPMLLLMVSFLIQAGLSSRKNPLAAVFLTIIFLFAYRLVPLNGAEFDFAGLVLLTVSALAAALLLRYFQNIYWICILFFTVFWMTVLAFGSSSPAFIHILLAAQYESWEGFFTLKGFASTFILQLEIGLTALIIFISVLLRKTEINPFILDDE